ncbi:MAG TPA: hypothetical protein VKA84_07755 [Gemmatimonadaceae bacterium]|nr:hypothetical protein [Gemmatimonadaceae bacterium]
MSTSAFPPSDPRSGDRASEAEARRAREGTIGQLTERNVLVRGDESNDDLASLLSAVELFESKVASLGGDSFTNSPASSQPDEPSFVIPPRRSGESARAYADRIIDAADALGR